MVGAERLVQAMLGDVNDDAIPKSRLTLGQIEI
jgi:hypothetical protein